MLGSCPPQHFDIWLAWTTLYSTAFTSLLVSIGISAPFLDRLYINFTVMASADLDIHLDGDGLLLNHHGNAAVVTYHCCAMRLYVCSYPALILQTTYHCLCAAANDSRGPSACDS